MTPAYAMLDEKGDVILSSISKRIDLVRDFAILCGAPSAEPVPVFVGRVVTPEPGKLLPCPFCGGEAELFSWTDNHGNKLDRVVCDSCGVRTSDCFGEGLAARIWNTRASLPPAPAGEG